MWITLNQSTTKYLLTTTLKVEKKGVIYFEDVCKLILRKFREDDETEFIKIMFKVREPNSSLSSRYPNKFPIIADVRKQIFLLWTIYVCTRYRGEKNSWNKTERRHLHGSTDRRALFLMIVWCVQHNCFIYFSSSNS